MVRLTGLVNAPEASESCAAKTFPVLNVPLVVYVMTTVLPGQTLAGAMELIVIVWEKPATDSPTTNNHTKK